MSCWFPWGVSPCDNRPAIGVVADHACGKPRCGPLAGAAPRRSADCQRLSTGPLITCRVWLGVWASACRGDHSGGVLRRWCGRVADDPRARASRRPRADALLCCAPAPPAPATGRVALVCERAASAGRHRHDRKAAAPARRSTDRQRLNPKCLCPGGGSLTDDLTDEEAAELAGLTTAWHVTSSVNRASILEHGLDWRRMGATGGIATGVVFRGPEMDAVFLCESLY